MKVKRVVACLGVSWMLAGAAAAAADAASRPVLAGTMTVAPFADVAQKVSHLGAMINNPIVPMLVLTPMQQRLVSGYGTFRMDSPIYVLGYVDTPAWDIAATNADVVAASSLFRTAVVYPAVEGLARMALNHPGATRSPDGTLHLLPNENRPEDLYVRFAAEGGYCAFAGSPALAAQALVDAAPFIAERKKTNAVRKDPLVRVNVTKRGVTALARLGEGHAAAVKNLDMKGAYAILARVDRLDFALDLDESGLVLTSRISGAPTLAKSLGADFALPAGVLDRVPATAPLFVFGGNRLLLQGADEKTFRAEQIRMLTALEAWAAGTDKKAKKTDLFASDIRKAAEKAVRAMVYPAATDWSGAWVAFDAAKRPSLVRVERSAQASAQRTAIETFCGDVAAAASRQWPDQRIWTRGGDGAYLLDGAALLDLCGQEAGVKKTDKEHADVEMAKKRLGAVFGGERLAVRTTLTDGVLCTRIQTAGVTAPAAPAAGAGEARARAALPEIAKTRPALLLYFSLYESVRGNVLPILMKTASEKDVAGYKTMQTALAPAGANSALAGAVWAERDGGVRSVLRVTANEMKNLGAAFNAFTAAAISGAVSGGDEAGE